MFDGVTEKLNRIMDRVDDFQRSKAPLGVANGVLKKYGDDRGSQLAKLLAYNGFFSMFPLLLASVAVLGIVLRGNPDLRDRVIDSALSSIPVLGSELGKTHQLEGGGAVLVVSILLAFWAGLGLLDTLQESLNTVWNVPRFDRPGWVPRRARAAGGALVIILCAGLSGAGNWILGTRLIDPVRVAIGAVFPIAAGFAAFILLHKILCARKLTVRELLAGAVASGLGWWGLFSLGNLYFNRVVKNASDTYGAFAVVLGLLSWSVLLGTMFIYSTEISSVMSDRLWPRSLTGRRLTTADEEAIEAVAQREVKTKVVDVIIDVREPAESEERGAEAAPDGTTHDDVPTAESDGRDRQLSAHSRAGADDRASSTAPASLEPSRSWKVEALLRILVVAVIGWFSRRSASERR